MISMRNQYERKVNFIQSRHKTVLDSLNIIYSLSYAGFLNIKAFKPLNGEDGSLIPLSHTLTECTRVLKKHKIL